MRSGLPSPPVKIFRERFTARRDSARYVKHWHTTSRIIIARYLISPCHFEYYCQLKRLIKTPPSTTQIRRPRGSRSGSTRAQLTTPIARHSRSQQSATVSVLPPTTTTISRRGRSRLGSRALIDDMLAPANSATLILRLAVDLRID